jgi:hypothetical protein
LAGAGTKNAARNRVPGGADWAERQLLEAVGGAYFMVGMTKAESSTAPSGQRAVTVLTLV